MTFCAAARRNLSEPPRRVAVGVSTRCFGVSISRRASMGCKRRTLTMDCNVAPWMGLRSRRDRTQYGPAAVRSSVVPAASALATRVRSG